MRLLLIRHPKPAVPEGTCYGRTDVAPDEAHLESMLERLRARWSSGAHATPLAVFSSPLQRCARVARALAGELWPQPRFDERLAEMHFGDWEGRMWAQIPREQLDAWRADLVDLRPPGGESVRDMAERAQAFAQQHLLASGAAPDAEIVLVTHAGIIQTLPRMLQQVPLGEFRMSRLDYGTITTLALRDGRFELEGHNVAP